MCVTICGRFRLNEGGVAGYVNRMKAKYTANWGVQIAGMIFQTRSKVRIECESFSKHSTHSNRVTNIGYLLSLGASPLACANYYLQNINMFSSQCLIHASYRAELSTHRAGILMFWFSVIADCFGCFRIHCTFPLCFPI